jgi:hypothetical protein
MKKEPSLLACALNSSRTKVSEEKKKIQSLAMSPWKVELQPVAHYENMAVHYEPILVCSIHGKQTSQRLVGFEYGCDGHLQSW